MVTLAPASAGAPTRALAPAPAGPGISFACGNPRHEHSTPRDAQACNARVVEAGAIIVRERAARCVP